MAWPRDKAKIIEELEHSVSHLDNCIDLLEFVKRHLEIRYRETGDALDLAAAEKIEQVFLRIEQVFQSWRFIRSFHFEQGILFEEQDEREDHDQEALG